MIVLGPEDDPVLFNLTLEKYKAILDDKSTLVNYFSEQDKIESS
jgi:hypothetical protein